MTAQLAAHFPPSEQRYSPLDQIEDRKLPFTITGAPRIVKGRLIVGNGGAEYGVRG